LALPIFNLLGKNMSDPLCPKCKQETIWKIDMFYRYQQDEAESLFQGWWCPLCKYFILHETECDMEEK
jgi:hypothetical protein